MELKWILNIVAILFYCSSFSQPFINIPPKNLPHGTLVVTVICEDGILIAADSRACFTVTKGDIEIPYAYIENNQKIFNLKNFKIGISGISMFKKKFMYQIFNKFNRTHKATTTIASAYNDFHEFLTKKIEIPDSVIFKENQFIIAGYEDSISITMGINSSDTVIVKRLGGLIHSDKDFVGYLSKPTNLKLTCKNIAPLLESAIYNFAKDKNDFKIGGPINIIQIKPDNTSLELYPINAVKFKSYKEQAKAIMKNKLDVIYLYPDSKDVLKKTLIEGIKLGY